MGNANHYLRIMQEGARAGGGGAIDSSRSHSPHPSSSFTHPSILLLTYLLALLTDLLTWLFARRGN